MRQLTILLLLTAAATPSLAARGEDGERRGGRPHRAESAERAPDRQRSAEPSRQQARAERLERRREAAETPTGGYVGGWRGVVGRGDASAGAGLMPRERRVRTIPDTQPAIIAPQGREPSVTLGHRVRRDYRDGDYTRWSSHRWRHDQRYDWRRYRDRHRSIFRLGFYYDPFGWNYRRWSVGSFLWPSYYDVHYRLNDPWRYRLPPAYGPYRWVRYWDDALLVNIYTGEVVDVIHNFFW